MLEAARTSWYARVTRKRVCRMGEKFGARLRQQREAQNVSLDRVAQQTKIKLTLLDAMEHDDVSAWPVGLFRRAFVRAYAQAVGLEPESAVREFLADFPDRIVRDSWTGTGGSEPATVARAVARRETRPIEPQTILSETIIDADVVGPAIVASESGSPAADSEPSSVATTVPADLDLDAVACLCTDLGRVEHASDVEPLLERFARIIEAKGVIIWVWDDPADALRPAVAHGYPDHVLARLPAVTRDADNLTAEAFRTARPCTMNGHGNATSALVVPMLGPAGCIGALGIEFERGAEPASSASAVAAIVAAFFSQLVGGQTTSEAVGRMASRESA